MFTLTLTGEEFHAGQTAENTDAKWREQAILDQITKVLREGLRLENVTAATFESPELGEVDVLPLIAPHEVGGIYDPSFGVPA